MESFDDDGPGILEVYSRPQRSLVLLSINLPMQICDSLGGG